MSTSIEKANGQPKFTKTANHDEFLKGKLMEVIQDPKRSYHEILQYIQNEITESTRTVNFEYTVRCFLEDGAWALSKAVEEINGFTTQKSKRTMSGDNPPTMLDVRFADGTHEKVPWGTISLPNFGNDAYIAMEYDHTSQEMYLSGACEKRYVRLMDRIVEETRRRLSFDSIYRSRAIKINAVDESPEFIDLSNVDKTNLFLTEEAMFETEPIEARIVRTEECVMAGIDLKFGVLLEGTYGTGKTLYAFKLAKKAIENDWSFVYCPDPMKALHVMRVAEMLSQNGKGVVVFLEDIDKILHERNNKTNEISLLMDGGESKNRNIITILTTNHIEKIEPTFLRGKRIGSVVQLTHPDASTAQKMIEAYLVDDMGRSILEEDCGEAAQEIENNKIVPAFIAEILDRVKSHLIYSGKKTVNCKDIINSIKSYKRQMDIAKVKQQTESKSEQLITLIREIFSSGGSSGAMTTKDLKELFKKNGFAV